MLSRSLSKVGLLLSVTPLANERPIQVSQPLELTHALVLLLRSADLDGELCVCRVSQFGVVVEVEGVSAAAASSFTALRLCTLFELGKAQASVK